MDIYEVVIKLVGEIRPVGETNEDNRRFENLKAMCELAEKLLVDIAYVACGKKQTEYSISRAGKYASDFFDDQGISE